MQDLSLTPLAASTIGLLAFVLAVSFSDLRSRRIPNRLNVGAALLGLGLSAAGGGTWGVLGSFAGMAVGLGVLLPFYLVRGFSAGDVKAMGAIGAFVGPKGALLTAAWILVVGSFGGFALLVRLGGWTAVKAMRDRWLTRVWILVATGTAPRMAPAANDPALHRFPYGLAIAGGTIAYLLWS